ncbi:2OG-Fe dioxygenase family protein [Sorangium sp. So ce448]|uniref:2OG-Fe dioxygenase family protein n=1 Tax=Sorangium sp. So ce448 TaxID=3133314 RepID=UPI003F61BF01
MDCEITKSTTLPQGLELALREPGYWFCPGAMFEQMPFFRPETWQRFADCWDRLTLDRYMGDGGVYRYRRFSELVCHPATGALLLQPHRPYTQPSYINTLNGGIERHFDPLEPVFVDDPFFRGLLLWCARSFANVSGHMGEWDIKVHPYRIVAAEDTSGHPTPEGLHRDGVDYILTMMVKRHNALGGETTVTTAEGAPLWRRVLLAPLDIVIADDARTKHAVTAVERRDRACSAHRDVLVVAFTRL